MARSAAQVAAQKKAALASAAKRKKHKAIAKAVADHKIEMDKIAGEKAKAKAQRNAELVKALKAYPKGIPLAERSRRNDGKPYSTKGYIGKPIKKARDYPAMGSKKAR